MLSNYSQIEVEIKHHLLARKEAPIERALINKIKYMCRREIQKY